MNIQILLATVALVLAQNSEARTVSDDVRSLLEVLREEEGGLYDHFGKDTFDGDSDSTGPASYEQEEKELLERSSTAAKPRSCADIKSMKGVTKDGDQCLALDNCSTTKGVKIFCGKMDTDSPREYLTLPKGESENYSLTDKHGSGCMYGKISYSKLYVNLTDMTIFVWDQDYTTKDLKDVGPYGQNKCDSFPQYGTAFSCSEFYSSRPKGEYKINLEGTGFYVPDVVSWHGMGWQPKLYTPQRTKQTLFQQCSGSCGGCYAKGGTGGRDIFTEPYTQRVMAIAYDWALDPSPCEL